MFNSLITLFNEVSDTFMTLMFRQIIISTLLFSIFLPLSLFFKKKNNRLLLALWSLILIRLIIPPHFSLKLNLYPLLKFTQSKTETIHSPQINDTVPTPYFNSSSMDISPSATQVTDLNNRNVISETVASTSSIQSKQSIPVEWIKLTLLMTWFSGLVFIILYIYTKKKAFIRQDHVEPIKNEKILSILKECQSQLRIRRSIALYTLDARTAVYSCGFLRPKIIIPLSLIDHCDSNKLKMILTHELIHIKRWDTIQLHMQYLITAFYFMHPVVWYINSKINELREQIVDSHVLHAVGVTPGSYSRMMIQMIGNHFSEKRFQFIPAVNFGSPRKKLTSRIENVLNSVKTTKFSKIQKLFIALLFLASISIGYYYVAKPVDSSSKLADSTLMEDDFGDVTCTISLKEGEKPDSIYVKLYPAPDHFDVQSDSIYHFKVLPGQYELFVYAQGFEPISKDIIVLDPDTDLEAYITLIPSGIDPVIKEVKLIGFLNNRGWTYDLVQKGEKWILPSSKEISEQSSYVFLVNNIPVNDLSNNNYSIGSSLLFLTNTGIYNLYQGGTIEFDPSLYQIKSDYSSITFDQFELQDQYQRMMGAIDYITADLPRAGDLYRENNPAKQERIYHSILTRIDSVIQHYDQAFKPILLLQRRNLVALYHPFRYAFWRKNDQFGQDNIRKLIELIDSDTFKDYFQEQLKSMSIFDPKSLLFRNEPGFGRELPQFDYYTSLVPEILSMHNLSKDYFYNLIINYVKNCPDRRFCTSLLYSTGSEYATNGVSEKAIYLINWLKQDFADEFYVGGGLADAALNQLKVSVGQQAPDFAVQTLSGDSIQLSDLRGKFVFLDFWGSWCGPCIGDIPYNIELFKSFSNDQLQFIGMANDDANNLRAFIEKENIPYPNVLANDELLTRYGINAFPTTLLIDPDGKIIAKNLDEENLVELVQEKMKEYRPTSNHSATILLGYIYYEDSTNAFSFKRLLSENGYSVKLIDIKNIPQTDFSPFSIILIGSNTEPGGWFFNSSHADILAKIDKKFLGLGEGGYTFLGNFNLEIGSPWGAHASDSGIYVLDPSLSIFHSPYKIDVQQSNPLYLYNNTSNVVGVADPLYLHSHTSNVIGVDSPSPGSTPIGHELFSSLHHSLAEQNGHVIWGFTEPPDSMTESGQMLFLNIVSHMVNNIPINTKINTTNLNEEEPSVQTEENLVEYQPPQSNQTTMQLGYIYHEDSTDAVSFKQLLSGNGYSVKLIDIDYIPQIDYHPFSMILIGPNTGFMRWNGDSSTIDILKNTGKKFLGIGEGGYAFLGNLSLNIGAPWGIHGDDTDISIPDASLSVFNTPHKIEVRKADSLQLYSQTSPVARIYLDSEKPGITRIGGKMGDDRYYSIIEQDDHVLWGFMESPDLMTDMGQALFLNIVDHMANENPIK